MHLTLYFIFFTHIWLSARTHVFDSSFTLFKISQNEICKCEITPHLKLRRLFNVLKEILQIKQLFVVHQVVCFLYFSTIGCNHFASTCSCENLCYDISARRKAESWGLKQYLRLMGLAWDKGYNNISISFRLPQYRITLLPNTFSLWHQVNNRFYLSILKSNKSYHDQS